MSPSCCRKFRLGMCSTTARCKRPTPRRSGDSRPMPRCEYVMPHRIGAVAIGRPAARSRPAPQQAHTLGGDGATDRHSHPRAPAERLESPCGRATSRRNDHAKSATAARAGASGDQLVSRRPRRTAHKYDGPKREKARVPRAFASLTIVVCVSPRCFRCLTNPASSVSDCIV
jgi:hypothetical protein